MDTMALWNLGKLAKTGFLTVSDGLLDDVLGGMEEVVTISLLQHIDPQNCLAKVLPVPYLHWVVDRMNAERKRLHEAKIKSKTSMFDYGVATPSNRNNKSSV
uniref:Uncharacterized protein n=1 Tax=Candidatus Kentrum sp. FW TaxID=2126338 RepID=A0A450SVF0_9GAMM|nr:MAG: hypothetical protein BECKFW1821B_GA0114236_10385 [Candidatus Kentron sp. FW]